MSHKKLGYKFENDWTIEEMRDDTEHYRAAVAVPVDVEIKADHMVLCYDRVKQYLEDATQISLMDCSCKNKRGNCDAPLDVCITLNGKAEIVLSTEKYAHLSPHIVTIDEALSTLERSHEAGLVHMAYTLKKDVAPDDVDYICSCCTCCCEILGSILRYGMAPHLLTSEMIEVTDYDKCNLCGVCVDRCQFGARQIINDALVVNHNLCFGCGLCVSTCPTSAIKLVDKE